MHASVNITLVSGQMQQSVWLKPWLVLDLFQTQMVRRFYILTKHKQNFNNNIGIYGVSLVFLLSPSESSVVWHQDRRVERAQQNQPIPANLEYPIMHQYKFGLFDLLNFIFRHFTGNGTELKREIITVIILTALLITSDGYCFYASFLCVDYNYF